MEKLLNTKELAEKLNIEPITLWRWRKKGCPWHPVGLKEYAYKEEEVREWLKKYRGK